MTIPFDQAPFSKLPGHLHSWMEGICKAVEADPNHQFWRDRFPEGSSVTDVITACACIAKLFPEKAAAENNTPVDVEFRL